MHIIKESDLAVDFVKNCRWMFLAPENSAD